MFSKRKSNEGSRREVHAAPSLISSDVSIVGALSSEGEIQIDGKVDGNVRAARVVVGRTGTIKGEVAAEDVSVHGEVTGPIRAHSVRLAAGARVAGDILNGTLSVETGAVFEGMIRRSENPLEELKKLPRPAEPESPDDKPDRKPAKTRAAKTKAASPRLPGTEKPVTAEELAAVHDDAAAESDDNTKTAEPAAAPDRDEPLPPPSPDFRLTLGR